MGPNLDPNLEEEEEEGTGQSRLFVIMSIALIGLLVLGLLGIGGVFVIRQNMEEQALASRPTPTVLVRLPEPSATAPPTRVPTNTPAPTPTNTPVVSSEGAAPAASGQLGGDTGAVGSDSGQEAPAAQPSPTRTPAPAAEIASATEVPNTGLGAAESVALAGGLIALFFVARRLRLRTH